MTSSPGRTLFRDVSHFSASSTSSAPTPRLGLPSQHPGALSPGLLSPNRFGSCFFRVSRPTHPRRAKHPVGTKKPSLVLPNHRARTWDGGGEPELLKLNMSSSRISDYSSWASEETRPAPTTLAGLSAPASITHGKSEDRAHPLNREGSYGKRLPDTASSDVVRSQRGVFDALSRESCTHTYTSPTDSETSASEKMC